MMKRVYLVVLGALLSSVGQGQTLPPADSVVYVGDKAFTIGPGELISAGASYFVSAVTPSGKYVIFGRYEYPNDSLRSRFMRTQAGTDSKVASDKQTLTYWVWNDQAHSATRISGAMHPDLPGVITPLGESGVALRYSTANGGTLTSIDLNRGSEKLILEQTGLVPTLTDDLRPQALLVSGLAPVESIDGKPTPRQAFLWTPKGIRGGPTMPDRFGFRSFLTDGSGALGWQFSSESKVPTFQVLDFATMTFRPARAEESQALQPKQGVHMSITGQKARVARLDVWVDEKATKSAAYMVAGVSSPELTEDGTKIIYQSQNCLFIADVLSVQRSQIEPALNARTQMLTMTDANQVIAGMMAYASENGGKLPPHEGFIGAMSGYFKDSSFLTKFNYTFAGTTLKGIADPNTTELGSIDGPGGRAVVYANGRAQWIPQP